VQFYVKYGWRKTYIYKNLDLDMISSDLYTNNENLLYQLVKDYEKLGQPSLSQNTLYQLGLKKTFAKIYFEIIEKLINTWYSDQHLLEFIVEFALKRYQPIGLPNQTYLYEPEIIQKWFKVNDILCFNVEDVNNIDDILEYHATNSKKNFMVYHACAWGYAENIIQDGVNRQISRECLDFGLFKSYLCDARCSNRL